MRQNFTNPCMTNKIRRKNYKTKKEKIINEQNY